MNRFITYANTMGKQRISFFFLIDFEMKKPFICPLDEITDRNIYFSLPDHQQFHKHRKENLIQKNSLILNDSDICYYPYEKYQKGFETVQKHLLHGDTYLLNLTYPSSIRTPLSLYNIFQHTEARYRLYFRDELVLFSPECFVKMKENRIYSYPVKGTAEVSTDKKNKQKLINNRKEIYEHYTIVDLIRNDLSMVSEQVCVPRFRELKEINAGRSGLYQVYSEICGNLPKDWRSHIGSILVRLLPAGSVSGAPKQKTLEIIRKAEDGDRGYYTGVFGVFDGETLDSAVNIRYIERAGNHLNYRSGGGITALSSAETEYNEMKRKIYVPFG